jgi:hypothetical protein
VIASPAAARAPLGIRVLAALATLASIAAMAAVVAYWAWRWFGPVPFHAAPPAGDDTAALAHSAIFGSAATTVAKGPAAAEALRGDVRLLGVIAEPDGRGRALFRLADGKAKLVATGEKVGDDATLVSVRPDEITIRGAGGERRIALRASAPPAAGKTASAVPRNPECAPPPGYTGAIVRLNAELVQGLIAKPESWRSIVEARDGALVVREEGGFAAMLGLRREDRIEVANGIALRVPEDVIGAVLRPLAASQSVRLAGTRAGQRREMLLQNAGRCPG